jgi:hypothetical protein
MATNTYVALDKATVTSATPSITFTGISQAYTDLVIIASSVVSTGAIEIQVGNGTIDTGTNYSRTYMYGNGTSALSDRNSNISNTYASAGASTSSFGVARINFMNYSNTTTFKTILLRSDDAAVNTNAAVSLWRSTAAINTIKINGFSANIAAGSTFSLYGIRAEGVSPTVKATGGAIYSDSTYYYHVFAGNGTFTPTQSITADVLCVAGGGGGGNNNRFCGGGGAGGLLDFASQSLTATGYTVTVGAGGAVTTNGVDTQFGALTLVKGGGAGSNGAGATGGSGAGGGLTTVGGSATSGQGSNGGSGVPTSTRTAGGGGGKGAVGGNASDAYGGNGGVGTNTYSSWVTATGTGASGYYSGGGGGSVYEYGDGVIDAGTGGLGGGGKGGRYATYAGLTFNAVAGTANTGGGGGGAAWPGSGADGAAGGSGLVIVRYAKA